MNKTALVTGGGRGLGAGLAWRLAQKGYAVAIHYYQSKEGAEELAQKIRMEGGTAQPLQGDLSTEASARQLMSKVEKHFGQLDALIHNSGVYHEKNLHELTEKQWHEGLDTTVNAACCTTRTALPLLRKSKRGRILYIGDSSCDRPGQRDLALSYHIGKTGVYILTRSFAASEASHGITVNMVSPGYLENSVAPLNPEQIPAGHLGSFDDIWNAVEFLLKKESSYITGGNLLVSGGWNLR
jgi:NAD(P)-dependent dehydrogenase (short-subunit alcohol dehydrogenase family)